MDSQNHYHAPRQSDRSTKPKTNYFSFSQSRALVNEQRGRNPGDSIHMLSNSVEKLPDLPFTPRILPEFTIGRPRPQPLTPSQLQNRGPGQRPSQPSNPFFASILRSSDLGTSTFAPQPSGDFKKEGNDEHRRTPPSSVTHGSPEGAYSHTTKALNVSPAVETFFHLSPIGPGQHPPQPPATSSGICGGPSQEYGNGSRGKGYSEKYLYMEFFELKKEKEALEVSHRKTLGDVDFYRSSLRSTSSRLDAAEAELTQLRPIKDDLTAREAELVATQSFLAETKVEMANLSKTLKDVGDAYNTEKNEHEYLKKKAASWKLVLDALKESYSLFETSLAGLRKAYDASQVELNKAKQDVEGSKKQTKDALAALESLLDETRTVSRALETKAVFKELQEDLAASQRVTDLLRDKLHNLSSQLADTQGRVRELEDERRGCIGELLTIRQDERQKTDKLLDLERIVQVNTDRLVKREEETMDLLAGAVTAEAKLCSATNEIQALKSSMESNCAEMEDLRRVKEESISKLLASQDVINARDRELISLKSEIKGLNERIAELRALLTETKKSLADKESELLARNLNIELEIENQNLKTQNDFLRRSDKSSREEMKSREQDFRSKIDALDAHHQELQISLTSAKDEIRVLATKEVLVTSKLDHLRKGEAKLLQDNVELKERLEVQSVELYKVKEEHMNVKACLAGQKASNASLITHAQLVTDSQQNVLSAVTSAIGNDNTRIAALEADLSETRAKLKEERTSLSTREQSTALSSNKRVQELKQQIDDLSRTCEDLSTQSARIVERYQEGKLSDAEKDLVNLVMSSSQSLYEQGVVEKNNELRRSQHNAKVLQSRISELEAALERLLKDQSKQSGEQWSMVDLSSDDRQPPDVGKEAGPSIVSGPNRSSVGDVIGRQMDVDKVGDPMLTTLGESDLSEDDIPLSELPGSPGHGHLGSKKRIRSPSPLVKEKPDNSKRRLRNSNMESSINVPAPSVPKKPGKGDKGDGSKARQKKRKPLA